MISLVCLRLHHSLDPPLARSSLDTSLSRERYVLAFTEEIVLMFAELEMGILGDDDLCVRLLDRHYLLHPRDIQSCYPCGQSG
jgi:hypothetical protein